MSDLFINVLGTFIWIVFIAAGVVGLIDTFRAQREWGNK